METGSTRPGGWRNASLGLLFVLLGALAFFAAPAGLRWQLAGAGVFLGAFVVVVLGPWSGTRIEAPGLVELYETLDGLTAGLHLDGPTYYVPAGAGTNLTTDRVLLAAHPIEEAQLAALDDETRLYQDKLHGLAIDPPGREMLDRHEQAMGLTLSLASIAELSSLMGGFPSGEQAIKGFTVRRQGETIHLRYEPTRWQNLAEHVHDAAPNLAARVGDPIASALLAALARSLGEAVRVDGIDAEGDQVEIEVTTRSP